MLYNYASYIGVMFTTPFDYLLILNFASWYVHVCYMVVCSIQVYIV